MTKMFLCRIDDVACDALKELTLDNGEKLCVMKSGDTIFACQAHCPHEGVPLRDACLDGTTLTCLEHLWQWDLRSGTPQGLAEAPLTMHELEIDGESVYLKG